MSFDQAAFVTRRSCDVGMIAAKRFFAKIERLLIDVRGLSIVAVVAIHLAQMIERHEYVGMFGPKTFSDIASTRTQSGIASAALPVSR